MKDVLIVGGGITGLTLAWALGERGIDTQVLEMRPHAGGNIRTLRLDNYLIDLGPNSLLERPGQGLAQILDALSLRPHVVEANPIASRRYVSRDGRALALPMSPMAFLRTPIFSLMGKLRLLQEPFIKPPSEEESVAAFVCRRLGPEFLDWAVDPFISGVYAGDAEKLSVRAATAKVYALEAESGSLIRGALKRARQGRASGPVPRGRLIGFHPGMQALPDALADRLGDRLKTGTAVTTLRRDTNAWKVGTENETFAAKRLILATPAYATADLLASFDARLAEDLRAIEYPGVVNLALGFARETIAHPLDGFGLLIPRREGKETLGVLFSSTLFPGRAAEGKALLTAFIGGARNPEVYLRENDDLIARVIEDLKPLLGISGEPEFAHVTRWPRAIPQYTLGHLERLARIDQAASALPDLHLAGNWRGGIAVGDCIDNALALAEKLA